MYLLCLGLVIFHLLPQFRGRSLAREDSGEMREEGGEVDGDGEEEGGVGGEGGEVGSRGEGLGLGNTRVILTDHGYEAVSDVITHAFSLLTLPDLTSLWP